MTSAQVSNNSEDVVKHAVELLSENDCILLRKSRKSSWYKPQLFQIHSRNKNIEDENILVDSGRRSKDRKKSKIEQSKNLKPKSTTEKLLPKNTPICEDQKKDVKMTRKNDCNINVSVDSMAHMIKLAISQKCDMLLEYLLGQLRGLKEETNNKVMDKLGFGERMIVIKSRYLMRHDKPPLPRKKRIVSPMGSSSCQRQSSSLTRIDKSLKRKINPIRRSFSFLVADLVENPFKSGGNKVTTLKQTSTKAFHRDAHTKIVKNDESIKEQKFSKVLIQQINHLQHQNGDLRNKIQELIFDKYNLEQKLTSSHRQISANGEVHSQIVSIRRCHDDIIDNVYEAYAQITKKLKNLKFNNKRTMSTTDLTRGKYNREPSAREPRSTSVDTTVRMKNETSIDKQYPFLMGHSSDSVTSLNEFLTNRKMILGSEINMTDLELKKINKMIEDDSKHSSNYEKNLQEKEFLEQHLNTLQKMLKSIEKECNN